MSKEEKHLQTKIRIFEDNRYTISKTQLALFTVVPKLISNRATFWLRDVVSSAYFAVVSDLGGSDCYGASSSFGVRPVFAIG